MKRLALAGVVAFAVGGAADRADAQTGVNCQSPDGRQLFVPGAAACPFGLVPSTRMTAPMPPQKAAFLARPAEEMAAVQKLLIQGEFLKGTADGAYGPATDQAIRAWQKAKGFAENGYLVEEQIALLRKDMEPPPPTAEVVDDGAPREFRCPGVGSVFVYQELTRSDAKQALGSRIAIGGSGLACFYLARGPAFGPYEEMATFSSFWRVVTEDEIDFAKALRAERLWPARVGHTLQVPLPAVGTRAPRDLEVRVEKAEIVATPAGRFPTLLFVIRDRIGSGEEQIELVSKFWWAPEFGEVVRAMTRNVRTGAEEGWELSDVALP